MAYLQSRRCLALILTSVLCVLAFLLAAGEARAQQRYVPAKAIPAAQVVDGVPAATVEGEAPAPVIETPPAAEEEAFSVGLEPPVETLSAGLVPATVDLQDPGHEFAPEPMLRPEPMPDLIEYPDPVSVGEHEPWFVPARELWTGPEAYPASDLMVPVYLGPAYMFAPELQVPVPPSVLDQVGFEKNELPARTQEPLAPLPAGTRSSPLPQTGTDDTASSKPSPDGQKLAAAVPAVSKTPASMPGLPKSLAPEPDVQVRSAGGLPQSPSSLEVAASSAVETLQNAAANLAADVSGALAAGESSPESSAGTEGPAGETTPRPSSPSAPAGGSSFSLSGSGQASPGGGLVPLLLCVLTSGLILLRRDGPLSLATCEPPKPSSALLVPLERPG